MKTIAGAQFPPKIVSGPTRCVADIAPDKTGVTNHAPTNANIKFSKWLSFYTKLLVVVTFFLVIAGGLVTSTKSGLAVPDWPLSYGKLMPPMVGGIRFEHTHRMIASLVGLMTLVLTIWIGFTENRKWLRWMGIAAFGMVVSQGILGGLTVLYLLPAPISVTHACLAQTFFAFMVCLAYVTSREWSEEFSPPGLDFSSVKKLLLLTVALIYTQLILGAAFRHTGNRLILIPHVVSAFLVLIDILLVLTTIMKNMASQKKLMYPAILLGALAVLQMGLGMGAFIFVVSLASAHVEPSAGHVFFVTSHQTLGALLLAAAVFLTLRVSRMEKFK